MECGVSTPLSGARLDARCARHWLAPVIAKIMQPRLVHILVSLCISIFAGIKIYVLYSAISRNGWTVPVLINPGILAFVLFAFYRGLNCERAQVTWLIIIGFAGSARALIFHPSDLFAWLEVGASVALGIAASAWWVAFQRMTWLASIELLPLRTKIEFAKSLYGKPAEVADDEKRSACTQYTFEPGERHRVVVTELEGLVHSVTYWSYWPYHLR